MRDARDAEDKRLLENGEIDLLLAGWVETIRGSCIARMRGPVGEDVAQAVCERLWHELKAGKHRDGKLPFRVIVYSVIGWVCSGWYEPGWQRERAARPRRRGSRRDGGVVIGLTLEQFVATLPPATGRSARLSLPRRPRAGGDRRAARQEAERRLPGDPADQDEAAGVARGMKVELETLLDELARRHARGEPLDVEGTLLQGGRPRRRARAADRGVPRPRPAPRADRRGARVRALARRPADAARPRREGAQGRRRRGRDRHRLQGAPGGAPEGAPLLPAARGRHPRPVARRGVRVGRDHDRPRSPARCACSRRVSRRMPRLSPMYRAGQAVRARRHPARAAPAVGAGPARRSRRPLPRRPTRGLTPKRLVPVMPSDRQRPDVSADAWAAGARRPAGRVGAWLQPGTFACSPVNPAARASRETRAA